jgi:methyl-accepting chemotaxis protein
MPRLKKHDVYWIYATAPIIIVLGLAIWARDFVFLAVERNPALNLAILGIILGGVAVALAKLISFQREARILDAFITSFRTHQSLELAIETLPKRDSSIGSTLQHIARSKGRIEGPAGQVALIEELAQLRESFHSELSLPTFLSGFMIALGLFGTFIGLLDTLQATGDLISNFANGAGDTNAAVERLVKGMRGPLSGMATSFSASLFGLLGSLLLGAMLNALQALAHKLEHGLRHFLDDIMVRAQEAASGHLAAQAQTKLALSAEFLTNFLERMTEQHKAAMDLFLESKEADLFVAKTLSQIATNMETQQRGVDQIVAAQDTLNRALATQLGVVDELRAAITNQTDAVTSVKRSHENLVRVTEAVSGSADDIRRMVGEIDSTQRRVLATEKKSSEIFEALMAGISSLKEQDMTLRDMQRAAIDSVKHASQIGSRLNESGVVFLQVRDTLSELSEALQMRFAELQRDQNRYQDATLSGLRDLIATLEFKDSTVVGSLRDQSSVLGDIGRHLEQIGRHTGAQVLNPDGLDRLANVLARQLKSVYDPLTPEGRQVIAPGEAEARSAGQAT